MSEITRNQAIQIVEDIRTAISAGSVTNTMEAQVLEYCVSVLGRRIVEASLSGHIENLPDVAAFLEGISPSATLKALLEGITDAVEVINANIGNGYVYAGIATPSGTPVSGKVFYLAKQAGQYANFGGLTVTEGVNILKRNGSTWTQEQLLSMADIRKNPLIGYYECDTAGNTAAKTVTAAGYVLPATGGSVKIKMANRNTVANATLNINSTGAKPLYYNGRRAGVGNTWDTNEIIEVFYDGAKYQAYNVAGRNGDGVFDISAYNLTDGQPTTYEDLAAALGPNGDNVPLSLRKGGMSIKFVQSSDNKYVQYRLTVDAFTTDVTKWQNMGDFVEEKEHPITEQNVVGYLTDKNMSVIGKLMKNGAVEWMVENSKDIANNERFENIDDLLSYVSSEVPDSDSGVIKYLTDKDGIVIATINNVGDTEFKGGGGFDGEVSKSRNIGFDAVKVLTDNKGTVIGWITSKGKVHAEELEVKNLTIEDGGGDIGVPNELITFLSVIANGTENHKFVTDRTIAFLKKQKNNYNRDGVDIETFPVISIHDDDALDYQLPQSYSSSATSETTPSLSYQNLGGFATLLFPILKSLNLKHDGDMLGKLSCGVASEGQRIGLTPLYGMEDTFDGHLNTCGETIKALVEKEGWECICHSMTARYVSNSYLVNGIDSEFANSLLVDATYASTNGLGWSTTTCYDTVTKKNYKIKQDLSGWDECPLHYAKPYLAVSKDANSRLVINPTYSVKYQVKTWLDRCDKAGMPHTRYACGWGSSQSGWHVLEDQKYIDVILAQASTQSNKPPMLVCPTRNGIGVSPTSNNITEHDNDYNVYNKSDYQKFISMIDECVESKSWRIFRFHAYEAQYRNEYRSYFTDYGEQHLNLYGADAADCGPLCYYDTNYPSEWIQPLKYAELMDMIGDNINDYWNNPPARLNINSWDEWYPCPGTTLAMFYDLMEYAISRGVTFMRGQDVLDLFGNILGVGCETSDTMAPDKRLADEDRVKWFCKIGADNSFTLKY